ncbi:MAG: hypothetical protein MJE68_25245, partial [Proteobacteria bacterium]|nr:hypothetical protein [Pseudomonadota bacterium]
MPVKLLYRADTLPRSYSNSRTRLSAGKGGDIRELNDQVPPRNKAEIGNVQSGTETGSSLLTGSYESFATSKKGSTRVGLSVHGGRYEIYLGMGAEAKQA